jgi:hypothetical protein
MNPINEILDKYGFQDKFKVMSAILEVLDKYNHYLMEHGYTDSDVYSEHPSAIDRFILKEKDIY